MTPRRWLIGLGLLLLSFVGTSEAATRYAATTGAGSAPCTTSAPAASRCPLQTAINAASQGDTVLVASGTYTGNYTAGSNAGISGAPILLQSETLHGATIQGNGSNASFDQNFGITVNRNFWIVDGFQFTNHRRSIRVVSGADDVIIRKNLSYNFNDAGIVVEPSGSDRPLIEENVVGQGFINSNNADGYAGIVINQTNLATVRRNIVYSIGNNAFIQVGSFGTAGYSLVGILTQNSTIQGNVLIDGAKGTGIRMFTFNTCAAPGGPWSSNSLIRDNIIAHGQGGGVALAENSRNSSVLNNLMYGVFFHSFGGKGNNPGGNIYRHNTVVLNDYGWMASRLETDDAPPCSTNTGDLNVTLQSNLIVNTVNANRVLQYVTGNPFGTRGFNLFWSPTTPSSSWFQGYTTQGTDVLQSPTFVNAAAGNFALATGSPGKNAGHDGADIGIAYNSFLTTALANNVVNLPVQEWTNPGSSTSQTFTVTAGQWYQAFAYIPDSGFFTGQQQWNVEGGLSSNLNIQSNVMGGCCGPWVLNPPSRWIYLGTRNAGDTSFTISWQNANATGKLRIRQMPTPGAAYAWLSGADTTPPAAPTGLSATQASSSQINLNWTPPADGDLAGYRITYCQGASCTPASVLPDIGLVSTFAHTGLSANTLYRYKMVARDTAANLSVETSVVEDTTDPLVSPWVGSIATGSDDAEQLLSTGTVLLTQPSLELGEELAGAQLVGYRFANVQVPQGVALSNTTKLQLTGSTLQFPNTVVTDLSDDFAVAGRDAALWTETTFAGTNDPLVTVVETTGAVVITPRAGQTGDHYNGYRSTNTFDFTDGALVVEVPQITSTSTSANTELIIGADDNNYAMIVTEGDQLYFQHKLAGSTTSTNVTYNASTHRWWRIQHLVTANVLTFDTSPDGSTWTQRRSVATGITLTAVRVALVAGTYEPVTAPGTASFDNASLRRQTTTAPALSLRTQSAIDPSTFTTATNNLGGRTLRPEAVPWSPAAWTSATADAAALSPNLAPLLQPIVSDPTWAPGKAIVILISGTGGARSSDAYEVSPSTAARLTIAWGAVDTNAPKAPTSLQLSAGTDPATQITAQWTAPTENIDDNSPLTDLDHYVIYSCTGAACSPTVALDNQIALFPLTYLALNLTPATTYGFAVAAVDANDNESTKSSPTSYLATSAGTPIATGITQDVSRCYFAHTPVGSRPKHDVNVTCTVPSPSNVRLHIGLRNSSGSDRAAEVYPLWCREGAGAWTKLTNQGCTDFNLCYGTDQVVQADQVLPTGTLPLGGLTYATGRANQGTLLPTPMAIPDGGQIEYLNLMHVAKSLATATSFECCHRYADDTELEACIPATIQVGAPAYVSR